MNKNLFLKMIVVLIIIMSLAGQAIACTVYSSYNGSQLGVTLRDMNTLTQIRYFDTGVSASGIAVDPGTNIYLASANHLYKYNNSGNLLVNMTFPIATINYTDVAISCGGDKVYASYKGSQQGVTIRDANTLNQISYFNTGINANGIAVDCDNNVYLAAGNHLYKYNSSGALLVNMTFPDAGINYTSIAVSGGKVYATYAGSQLGVTIRDANTLNQLALFNTGVTASGISVDLNNNVLYLSATNHLYKYSFTGTLLTNMTFPINSINYTGVAFK